MRVWLPWILEFADLKIDALKIQEILIDLGIEAEIISKDTIDIEVSPNRGDCLSILGIARELGAKLGKPLKLPCPKISEYNLNKRLIPEFQEELKKFIPRYSYRIIEGVKVKESPKEIVKKLNSYGFRSLNNIVDITNLVMIELGQPLHAFDYEKLGGKLRFRFSYKGEKIITLDGKERVLPEKAIIAEDREGRLTDLAGIMGGFYSEIDGNTKNIVLQSAIFDPILIRKASKFVHHTTDASYRYERGVDFECALLALDRATELILKTTNGKASKVKDIIFVSPEERWIEFSIDRINKLLGTNFSEEDIEIALKRLGFEIIENKAKVPSFRKFDIYFWEDLAEEVLRFWGYSKIKGEELDKKEKLPNITFSLKEKIKDLLVERGFSETLSYSFISDKDVEIFNLDENRLLRIKNPLSAEFSFFRPNLLINVLKQVAKNPFFPEIRMFEIGRIHFDGIEEEEIIILINSNNRKELEDIKATLEKLGLNLEFSEVPQKIREIFKIKKNIFYLIGKLSYPRKGFFEFNDLTVKSCKVPSEFPPVQIDLAFIVEKDLSPKLIEKEFYSHPNVILVELFDEFASDKFGKDKKNVAYHLWLGDERGPLRDSKVKIIIEEIVRKIGQKFKAKLRDF